MQQHQVRLTDGKEVSAILYPARPPRLEACFILAHGAGAGQTSSFIREFATELAGRGIDVFTFNFPYMEAGRKVPDRAQTLEECFRAAIERCRDLAGPGTRIYAGGKSLGGRIASHLAARMDTPVAGLSGLILLGYPLHPPGKPDRLRTAHLASIFLRTLVVQGTRDAFGIPEELERWFQRPGMTIHPVPGGDHSFKVPKGSGQTQAQVFSEIQETIARWIDSA
jgi:uncharacterized protein